MSEFAALIWAKSFMKKRENGGVEWRDRNMIFYDFMCRAAIELDELEVLANVETL